MKLYPKSELCDISDVFGAVNDLKNRTIPQSLFDKIGNYNLDIDVGYTELNLERRRKVCDNHNGSFSVIDQFLPHLDLTIATPWFIEVGAGGGPGLIVVKQSNNLDVPQRDEEFMKGNGKKKALRDWAGQAVKSSDISVEAISSNWRARNIPKDFPVSSESLVDERQYQAGDVISLSAFGGLSLGVSFPPGYGPVNLGAGLFVRGAWRVTILKEAGSVVSLKVQRVPGQVGQYLYGDVVVFPINVFSLFPEVSNYVSTFPIRFSADQSTDTVFDWGYQYDLSNKCAAESFDRAILFDLIPTSTGLTKEDCGIKSLGRRTTEHSRGSDNRRVQKKFFLIFKNFLATNKNICANITLNDDLGKTISFECLSSLQRESNSWITKRRMSRHFDVLTNIFYDQDTGVEKDIKIRSNISFFDTKLSQRSFDEIKDFFVRALANYTVIGTQIRNATLDRPNQLARISLDFSLTESAARAIIQMSQDTVWQAIARSIGVVDHSWDTDASRHMFTLNSLTKQNWCLNTSAIMGPNAKCIQLYLAAKEVVDAFAKIQKSTNTPDRVRQLSNLHRQLGFKPLLIQLLLQLAPPESAQIRLRFEGDSWATPVVLNAEPVPTSTISGMLSRPLSVELRPEN